MKVVLLTSLMILSTNAFGWLGGQISNGASNTPICTKEFGGKIHSCSGADVVTYQSAGKPYCSCKNNAFVTAPPATGATATELPDRNLRNIQRPKTNVSK